MTPNENRPLLLLYCPIIAGLIVGLLCCPPSTLAQGELSNSQWMEKIHAGWVGKVSAGSGALPTELMSKEQIRRKYGVFDNPPQTPTPRGPLDDTTLALLSWHTVRERGPLFTTEDIARQWVEHLTDADLQGGGFGQEFLDALRRLRGGERPPIRTGTPRAEWIAAQMRAEIWGMLAPGDPALAAEYARRDAKLFNTGNGVYAAQFVAVLASQLMVDPDIAKAIQNAQLHIPKGSALAQLVTDTLRWHAAHPNDWETVWQEFTDTYRDRSLEKAFVAWNAQWLVETGGWPEAEVLSEYHGRRNVLRSHPFSETEPALLTTVAKVPQSGGTLRLSVNCNERPAHVDWLLRICIDGITAREETIRWVEGEPRWQEFSVDLMSRRGRQVTITLENAVTGNFGWEAGFWTPPKLMDNQGRALDARRPVGHPYRYPLGFTPRILPETFAVLVGLLYGEGDFCKSVSLTTMCGFDTDCNAGTVGCLLGLRNGLGSIPAQWKDPIQDKYEVQVTGLARDWRIAELAKQIAETGMALAKDRTPGASPPSTAPPEASSLKTPGTQ